MATLREIKQRIKSIKSTQQITKAMKMVAAAKMRRAQERMFAARPYAGKIKELIQNLAANAESSQSPLLQVRPVKRLRLVVITADRGLCGAFNSHIIRNAVNECATYVDQEVSMICVGKKGYDFFRKRDYQIAQQFSGIFHELQYAHADQIAQSLIRDFVEDRIDAVRLIYNEFKSVANQQLVVEDLLPLKLDEFEETTPTDYLYEPSQEALLQALLPKHIRMQVWRALLESNASEQAARMIAMENATDNASELIRTLTLQCNKARQASITKEILEIVGGAEALKAS